MNLTLGGLVTVNVNVTVSLSPTLEKLLMSVFSDLATQLETEIDAATARVQKDVAGLKQQIADLQAKIDAGVATPEEIARFQAAVTAVKAIDPTDPTVLPPTPST